MFFFYQSQAEEDVEKFLKESHSFEDYAREVRKYSKIEKDIMYNSRKVIRRGRENCMMIKW